MERRHRLAPLYCTSWLVHEQAQTDHGSSFCEALRHIHD